jgi:hypothetical protein
MLQEMGFKVEFANDGIENIYSFVWNYICVCYMYIKWIQFEYIYIYGYVYT